MTSKSNIPQFYFPKYAFAESKQDGKCQQTQTKNDLLMVQ
jgi:hypothetical protein